jgi:hypothetical protein
VDKGSLTLSSPGTKPVVVIACEVLQDMLVNLLPDGLADEITFFDFAMHVTPRKMVQTLQDAIDSIEQSSLVVLGYGLCGNGLNGIKAGKHTLLLPRVDDCIAMILGSREAYRKEFEKEPGTYYLSKGWLEANNRRIDQPEEGVSDPLAAYELYVSQYGPETAKWLMDIQYQNYKRLALVAHDQSDLEECRPRAQEVARYCQQWGMRYEEILGSDAYVRRLLEVATTPEMADDDFLVIPPGGEIRQVQFIS